MKAMTRIFRSKKALSPVISTVLMILVVMVGMSVVFSSVVFYADSYRAGQGSSVLESLTIEDVWIQTPNTVDLWVYNAATVANLGTSAGIVTTITNVYVNGVALSPLSNGNTIDFGRPVSPGGHVMVACQLPPSPAGFGTFQHGETYTFKIVTSRGSNFQTQTEYSS